MSVKVRFAPSPTGNIHLGNARMAMLNYFLAKKLNGSFILRIDDTDTKRVKQEYIDGLKEDLNWLGVTWEEEFKQSDRLKIYDEFITSLKTKGMLYECFETPEELEYKKKLQLAKGKPPIYDRASLNLSTEQKDAYIKEGRKPYLRLKISPTEIKWTDIIKGEISFKGENISDPVVVREDGSYLYILTSVLDDIQKGITHIIRGEDHIVNTAVQIQVFDYLKAPIPQFAHLPLITNNNGVGFSKRDGSLSLKNLKAEGILPMAINNYLYSLGLGEQNVVYKSIDEIIAVFNLNKYSSATAKFDKQKLLRTNLILFQVANFSDISNLCQEYLGLAITEPFWNAIKENIEVFQDIATWYNIIYDDASFVTSSDKFSTLNSKVLEAALTSIDKYDDTADSNFWASWQEDIKSISGVHGKELFLTLRLALMGRKNGPEFKQFLPLINKNKIIDKLNSALNNAKTP